MPWRLFRELILLVAALLAAEFLVTAATPASWTENVTVSHLLELQSTAAKLGIPFDSRTVSEVTAALRARGVDALPGIGRGWAGEPPIRRHLPSGFYPLSQASHAVIVECNETGRYLTYRTDEMGFNNPPGLIASGDVDIAVVGESHALGYCLPSEESLVGRLRRWYPKTANLALADTRPLSQLASFREYVEPLEPPIVVWVVNPGYAGRDTHSLDPWLQRYWNPSFSQHLLKRQAEVDAIVRRWSLPSQAAQDEAIREELARADARRFSQIFFLPQLRQHLRLHHGAGLADEPPDFSSLARSLAMADAATRQWGGRLVAVILPAYGQALGEEPEERRYREVSRVVRRLGIESVDGASLFLSQQDPLALYTMRLRNHPNSRGYALLAGELVRELERREPLRLAGATPARGAT